MQLSACVVVAALFVCLLLVFVCQNPSARRLTDCGGHTSQLSAGTVVVCLCADFRSSSFCGGELQHVYVSPLHVTGSRDSGRRSSSSSCRAAYSNTGCHATVTCCSRSPLSPVSCCLSLPSVRTVTSSKSPLGPL